MVRTQFADVKITKRFAHVNLEPRVTQESNALDNRASVKVQAIVEIEPFARPMFADSSVTMTLNVSTMKNVPKVFVHLLVRLTKLVLLVSSANRVNVKRVVDLMSNAHLLVPV